MDDTTSSREALLEAAWRITVESFGLAESDLPPDEVPAAKIFEQLKTNDVARRAGLSTGAFFNRWPSRDRFLDDFLDYALSVHRYPGPDSLFQVLAAMADRPWPDVIAAMCATNLAEYEENPALVVQSHLWTFCLQRDDVARRLRVVFRDLRDLMVPFYETVLGRLGREMRPPFTLETGSSLLNIVAMGLAQHRVAGGDAAPPAELLAWTVLALLPAATRAIGDERTLDRYVGEELGFG